MMTVAERWDRFVLLVLPPSAPLIQRREMRRAFYAGFSEALAAGIEMAEESGPDDDLGATMMRRLHNECEQFALDVAAGEA